MIRLVLTSLVALVATLASSVGVVHAQPRARTRVSIDGVYVPVSCNDGDTFRVLGGRYSGSSARLAGFNTLESYGPVHQWGNWNAYELYAIAKIAWRHSVQGTWHCRTLDGGRRDGYGRYLMECPDLIVASLRLGLAHAMNVNDTPARPEYLRAQQEAIRARRGMWAHGVPDFLITSTHSADEDLDRHQGYNRLVSTEDGHSEPWNHTDDYAECAWVCRDETRVDRARIDEAIRTLRENPAVPESIRALDNVHLRNLISRFARRDELPDWLDAVSSEADREAIGNRLEAMRAAGALGTLVRAPGACMIHVAFDRRFTSSRGPRATCLEHP